MTMTALVLALTLGASSHAVELGEDFQSALNSLEGEWSGVLIYRDYRTDRRVTLPHSRTVSVAPDGSYAQSDLVFTDPGYQVYSSELVTLTGTRVHMAYASGGEINLSVAEIESFEATATGWTATLTGPTLDAGQQVEARYTYVIDGSTMSIEKAVRANDEDAFLFRNGVEMTRQ